MRVWLFVYKAHKRTPGVLEILVHDLKGRLSPLWVVVMVVWTL